MGVAPGAGDLPAVSGQNLSPIPVEGVMKKSQRARKQESSNDADRPSPAPEAAADQSGHDERGRFAAGNPGGPGNPFARRVAQLRKVMLECVTDQEMEIIVCELVVQAKMGNLAAIKLLFQYILGKPAAVVNPDTVDQQEVELFGREPLFAHFCELLQTRMPSGNAAHLLRNLLPGVGQKQANIMLEEIDKYQAEQEEAGDDFDDDEELDAEAEAVTDAGRQAAAVGSGAAAAPSPNGGMGDGPRPRATRPERSGGPGTGRPGAAPGERGRNGQPRPRRDGPTFIDPR
jgi:hypothetical protein